MANAAETRERKETMAKLQAAIRAALVAIVLFGAFASLPSVTVKFDPASVTVQVEVGSGMAANAQVVPPPPPPPPPEPAPSTSTQSGDHGGNRWKVTGKSVMQGQGISIGCWAVAAIIDSQLIKAPMRREPTPIEINTDGMFCGSIPAWLIGGVTWAKGIRDNACSYAVARRAFRENNSPEAKQALLWRDGSWERMQKKHLDAYFDCYHNAKQVTKKKLKKNKKSTKRPRR